MQTEDLIELAKQAYAICYDELLGYFEIWLGAMIAITILGLQVFPALALAYVVTIFTALAISAVYGITLLITWKE